LQPYILGAFLGGHTTRIPTHQGIVLLQQALLPVLGPFP